MCTPGTTLRAVLVVDGEAVADSEVDARRLIAEYVFDGDFFLTDEVEFPVVAVQHGSDPLDLLHRYVRTGFVRSEKKSAPTFRIEAFRKAELTV